MADIVLKWKGAEVRIPDDRAFELGEVVEDILTIGQIPALLQNPKFHIIARCFGAMLRFGGVRVSDREVHQSMMDALKNGEAGSGRLVAIDALMKISEVLMDGAPDGDGEADPEK